MSKGQDDANLIWGIFIFIVMILIVLAGAAGVFQLWMWVLQ